MKLTCCRCQSENIKQEPMTIVQNLTILKYVCSECKTIMFLEEEIYSIFIAIRDLTNNANHKQAK